MLQMFLASKIWKQVLEGFYTVILSNDLIQNKKNEYRDILNLTTYTQNSSNLFYLQLVLISLQVERWMCRKSVLYTAVMLLFLMPNMRYVAL